MKKISTLILLALLPLVASAYDAEIDGIYYNFSENEATVTYGDNTSNSYSGSVVIPASVTFDGKEYNVTAIGQNAFRDCVDLAEVTIPENVISIGDYAFMSSSLPSVTLPESVTSIGSYAFAGCYEMTGFTIPKSVNSIGYRAFAKCI